MYKWITKKEISKILKTYSTQKDEFLPVEGKDYFYQSQLVKGYTVTISEEIEQGKHYSEKTGRIIVSHTQWNGRKTFRDIWERGQNGILQFKFRNLWNQPVSDMAYIHDLEKENKRLLLYIEEMQEQFLVAQDMAQKSQLLINDTIDISSFQQMQERIKLLEEENQQLKKKTGHNARGAGRKPSPECSAAIQKAKELICSGYSEKEIMEKLQISRSTFFRYKKSIKNNL